MIVALALEVYTVGPRGNVRLGGDRRAPWVAELTGLTHNSDFARRYITGQVDYTRANSVGSRGVYRYYHLRPGPLYEVCRRQSWTRTERYFCHIKDGQIVRVPYADALRALDGTQHAAIPAISRGYHDD